MTKPLVSIASITYNHEKFIAQAIDSWLMQKTNFDVEIIIGEDCSTDKTRDIIVEYQAKYPDKIKLIASNNNIGMMQNFIQTLQACNGKYIALCEGDDYWTDPLKLQKQVDFLRNNKSYAICGHNVKSLRGEALYDTGIKENITVPLNELVKYNLLTTLSVLFRRESIRNLPEWFVNFPIGDWPLFILIAQTGKVYIMKDYMGVHRVHEKGAWSQIDQDKLVENNISILHKTNEVFDFKYDNIIRDTINILVKNPSLYFQPFSFLRIKIHTPNRSSSLLKRILKRLIAI